MKKVVSLVLIFIVLISSTVVYAENTNDSYEVNLKYSSSSIKPGDTVTLQIMIENINLEGGNGGVVGIIGTLSFDESIFELDKFEGTNWELTSNEKTFLANSKDGNIITEPTEIGEVTLKVKEEAKIGSTVVSILNIEGSVGSLALNDMEGQNKDLTLVVAETTEESKNDEPKNDEPKNDEPKNDEEKNEGGSNDNNKIDNNSEETSSGSKSSDNEKEENKTTTKIDNTSSTEDTTTAGKKIPQTGTIGFIIPIIVIAILGSVAIIFFKKYKKTI